MTTEELIDSQERRIKQLEMDLAVVTDLKGTISGQLDRIEQLEEALRNQQQDASITLRYFDLTPKRTPGPRGSAGDSGS